MASQRLIITKISGRASEVVRNNFVYWARQRTSDDRREWGPHQWPAPIRIEADQWFDDLRRHATGPPMLSYVEYNDYWSYCPPCRYIGELDCDLLGVYGNRYEGFCTTLPLKRVVVDSLRHTRRHGQWNEDRLFASLTLHIARD